MIKCVIFDVDGTMTNTMPLFELSYLRAYNEVANTPITLPQLRKSVGLSEEGMAKMLIPEKAQEVLAKYYTYYEELLKKTPGVAYFGIKKLINYLNDKGIKTAVVSGKGKPALDITFRVLGFEGLFKNVFAGLEETPDKAERIIKTMEILEVNPEETIYIGDIVSDITASQKANVRIISAGWDLKADRKELLKHNPDYFAYTVEDCYKILKGEIENVRII
ncbi:MAG: HAD family hydrolase [Clostridia bacterium]|nr:HAD family hydrolase [Clostridia bacterium]